MQLPELIKARLLKSSKPAPGLDQRGVQYKLTTSGRRQRQVAIQALEILEFELSQKGPTHRWLQLARRAKGG